MFTVFVVFTSSVVERSVEAADSNVSVEDNAATDPTASEETDAR